jgi:hypothetical protein
MLRRFVTSLTTRCLLPYRSVVCASTFTACFSEETDTSMKDYEYSARIQECIQMGNMLRAYRILLKVE